MPENQSTDFASLAVLLQCPIRREALHWAPDLSPWSSVVARSQFSEAQMAGLEGAYINASETWLYPVINGVILLL
ncbi:MAG: hypothetical protein KDC54_24175, partial [Lewinella sp.]|nr:hypothetical protein [Lewinella sp.]